MIMIRTRFSSRTRMARVNTIRAAKDKSVLYSGYHRPAWMIKGRAGGVKMTKELSLPRI